MPVNNMPKAEKDQQRIIAALEQIATYLLAINNNLGQLLLRTSERPPTG